MPVMKLLHVVPTYYPAVRYGGPIVSVHGLCKSLVAAGHQVDVATTNVDGPGVSDVPLGTPVDIDGVQIRYFPASRLLRRLYYSPAMRRWAHDTRLPYDVVHVHAAFLWPSHFFCQYARQCGVPYVLSPRGMLNPELVNARSRFIKALVIKYFDRHNVNHAASLHLTSEAEHQAVDAMGLEYRHVSRIPNGLDPDSIRFPSADRLHRRPYLLYLGRLARNKNPDVLIRALAQLEDLDLLLVGPDHEGLTDELTTLAHALGLGDRVHFIDQVGDEKWCYYRDAFAFCLPSDAENFANTVLEAASVGCPVLVSPGVGLSVAVQEAAAGEVVSVDPDAIAEVILRWQAEPEVREALIRGCDILRDRYHWSGIIGDYESMYRQVLPGTTRRLGDRS